MFWLLDKSDLSFRWLDAAAHGEEQRTPLIRLGNAGMTHQRTMIDHAMQFSDPFPRAAWHSPAVTYAARQSAFVRARTADPCDRSASIRQMLPVPRPRWETWTVVAHPRLMDGAGRIRFWIE